MRLLFFICGLVATGTMEILHAQGNSDPLYVLDTLGPSPLVSANVELDPRGLSDPKGLQFAFGFATDETLTPDRFLDSFTISVQSREVPGQIAFYLVIDASGIVIAPATPGALPLDPASISVTPTAFPPALTSLSHQSAFHLFAPLPEALADQPLNLYFDLFDNGDELNSLAWASEVILVPEPRTTILVLLGLALYTAGFTRTRR